MGNLMGGGDRLTTKAPAARKNLVLCVLPFTVDVMYYFNGRSESIRFTPNGFSLPLLLLDNPSLGMSVARIPVA